MRNVKERVASQINLIVATFDPYYRDLTEEQKKDFDDLKKCQSVLSKSFKPNISEPTDINA